MPGGAADLDGRLFSGDEIVAVDGQSVMGASHHVVVGMMGHAAQRGQVALTVRRRQPQGECPVMQPRLSAKLIPNPRWGVSCVGAGRPIDGWLQGLAPEARCSVGCQYGGRVNGGARRSGSALKFGFIRP